MKQRGAEKFRSNNTDAASFLVEVREGWVRAAANYHAQKRAGTLGILRAFAYNLTRFQYETTPGFRASFAQRPIASEADHFARSLAAYHDVLSDKRVIVFESSGWGINHPAFKASFDAAIRRHSPTLLVDVLDSNTFLSRGDYYFFDDHPTPRGHQRIAEKLHKAISLLLP